MNDINSSQGCAELWQAVIERAIIDAAKTGKDDTHKVANARRWLFDPISKKDRDIVAEMAGFDIEAWTPAIRYALDVVPSGKIGSYAKLIISRHSVNGGAK